MVLIIDNYDSFVFNVARYVAELGHVPQVVRNDAITMPEIRAMAPSAIIISPGPASPDEAGVSLDIVRALSGKAPILGICLGHQCIGQVFGGVIARASEPMHGRSSAIRHDGTGLFAGLQQPLTVGRYHSLIVQETPEMRQHLTVTARTETGEIMALAHKRYPTYGVQFHPESILSEHGHMVIGAFLQTGRSLNTSSRQFAV